MRRPLHVSRWTRARALSFWCALACLLAAQTVRGQSAEDDSAPRTSPVEARSESTSHFAFKFSLESRYDDNILQLSDCDQKLLENGVATCSGTVRTNRPGSNRFLISTVDDWVEIGRVDARIRLRPIRRRDTQISASVDLYRYSRNNIKNTQQYGLSVSQELTASKRNLTSLRAWASRVPSFYLRQLTDLDASFAARHRVRDSESYGQNEAGVEYRQRFIGGRLEAKAGWTHQNRNYNASFNERDSRDNAYSVDLKGRPLGSPRLELGVGYEKGELSARGDLPSTPIPDVDISYRHRALSLQAAGGWKGRRPGRLDVEVSRETRDFTTENIFDVAHSMRKDHLRNARLRALQSIGGRFELVAEARRLSKDATFPFASQFQEEEGDYVETRFSLGLAWSLSR